MSTYPDFDYPKHNFEVVSDTLKKYFPIDNPEVNNENIAEFKGFQEIGDLINENFFTQKNYRERWVKFKKFLKEQMKHPVEETMVAFFPCYSGAVVLKKIKNESYTIKKELHFYISLLGPFYSILGVDKSEITLEEVQTAFMDRSEGRFKKSYPAVNAITVSPYLEYEQPFKFLQKLIVDKFPNYQYIPFEIGMKTIPGISYIHQDSKGELKDSVYSALFRPDMEVVDEKRGDTHFGFDEWLKVKPLLPDEIKQIKDKLTKRSLINYDQHTLHKVWKLKSAQPIRSNPGMKNVTLATAMMEVIDITDKNIAIIIDSEKEAPTELPYTISDNEIYLGTSLKDTKFRVSKLTTDELILIMSINSFTKDGITLGGDIIELSFERYQ